MNFDSILSELTSSESILAIIFLVLAFIFGMMFVWIWLGGKIKDVQKSLEEEQLKNSGLLGKNEELENEAKVHLAEVNRIKIQNRETIAQNDSLLQEKDQLYSQVIMLSESEAVLKDELDDIRSRYVTMEASHQKMSSSLTQVSSNFETSVVQKDSLHSRILQLEAENEELMETRIRENASYRTQLSSLQETQNHLETEYNLAKNNYAANTEEFNDFKSKFISIKTEHTALASSHADLNADLEEKTAKLKRQEETIKSLLVKQNEYILALDAAKEGKVSYNSTDSSSREKDIAQVYNAQILSLQEALDVAINNLATLEAEKANTNEELENLRAQVNKEDPEVMSNDGNIASYSSFDNSTETSLAVELNVIKKQLKAEHQTRIEHQQDADRWRASLITLKADLAQAEEDRANEQENFLNELAELKKNHKEALELETQKLIESNTKIEELETKVTWLEAISNDAENETIHLEASQNNLLDLKNDKLSTVRDENMQLQSQVDGLLSKIRELQASSDEVGLMGDSDQDELIDGLEAQAVQLEATAGNASNDIQKQEAEHAQVVAAAKEQIDALNLQVDSAEAKIVLMEAHLNDSDNNIIELEEKYDKILGIENDKYASAKDNILNLETQVSLLEEKAVRLEAEANEAVNDYLEYEAKFDRLIDMEQAKLAAARDANIVLIEELAEFKLKAASNIPVVNENDAAPKPTRPFVDNNTNVRTDASLENNAMNVKEATKALKKLIGNAIPFASNQGDNLKIIKGIGPHIEGKLNTLGINSYQQISALTTAQIEILSTALDIFPGRIEQDNWVGQAKGLYKNNEALTPETARIAVQALIGNKIPTATASNKDDLKLIKGVGGFLEKKLNNIGIYTFEQISKLDNDAIEKITIAIEFFPDRIKRDNWVKQAKELM